MDSPLRSIHVVAGVITDVRGRVLLARRGEDSDLAGLWEFPGGKREPGETSEAALIRELQEELGIDVEVGDALIEVPQEYPGKRLRLEVRAIPRWKGTPRGREGQALTWVAPERLARYSMPSADVPVVGALRQPDRYLVTPEPGDDPTAWRRSLQQALDAGIGRVQLRARSLAPAAYAALAREVADACRRAGAELLLNRDIGLAAELGVGVQLGSEQLAGLADGMQPAEQAMGQATGVRDRKPTAGRGAATQPGSEPAAGQVVGMQAGSEPARPYARPLPVGQTVGASCHDLEDLRQAQALGCDFAVLGPVRETATHPGAVTLGWDGFVALREQVAIPIYAIGGLTVDDLPIARSHGAQGVAAIRSLWPG